MIPKHTPFSGNPPLDSRDFDDFDDLEDFEDDDAFFVAVSRSRPGTLVMTADGCCADEECGLAETVLVFIDDVDEE